MAGPEAGTIGLLEVREYGYGPNRVAECSATWSIRNVARRETLVRVGIIVERQPHLFKIVSALHSPSRFAGCLNCGKQ